MVKGGRVSGPKGLLSSILNIKPIVSIDDQGKSVLIGKTFSQASNVNLVMKKIALLQSKNAFWNYIVLHAHNQEGAEEYSRRMKTITGFEPLAVIDISPAIGMHAGIGATAISIMFT